VFGIGYWVFGVPSALRPPPTAGEICVERTGRDDKAYDEAYDKAVGRELPSAGGPLISHL